MNADCVFESFVDRVREKFGLRSRFKLKVKDDGDLITLGDADDWAMAVEAVRREVEGSETGGEMGKTEVSLVHFSERLTSFADGNAGLDTGCLMTGQRL